MTLDDIGAMMMKMSAQSGLSFQDMLTNLKNDLLASGHNLQAKRSWSAQAGDTQGLAEAWLYETPPAKVPHLVASPTQIRSPELTSLPSGPTVPPPIVSPQHVPGDAPKDGSTGVAKKDLRIVIDESPSGTATEAPVNALIAPSSNILGGGPPKVHVKEVRQRGAHGFVWS